MHRGKVGKRLREPPVCTLSCSGMLHRRRQ